MRSPHGWTRWMDVSDSFVTFGGGGGGGGGNGAKLHS